MDVLKEIKTISSKIRFLGREARHLEALMRDVGVDISGRRDNSEDESCDSIAAEIQEYYREIRKLLRHEIYLKKQLWVMLGDLPNGEMIEAITRVYIEQESISQAAEAMEYSPRQINRWISFARDFLNDRYENSAYMRDVKRAVRENKTLKELASGRNQVMS